MNAVHWFKKIGKKIDYSMTTWISFFLKPTKCLSSSGSQPVHSLSILFISLLLSRCKSRREEI